MPPSPGGLFVEFSGRYYVLMSDLSQHYSQLLGLGDDWSVSNVTLELESNRVLIELEHSADKISCPDCNCFCSKADSAPKRRWRHLDTMQFETILEASVPRSNCCDCGVKTIRIPWGDKGSRFTLMFEAFAIHVLQAASSVNKGAQLLRLSWHTAHQIMERAVERGLAARDEEPIKYVGIDEKSFGKGQDYISLMVDLDRSRVIEVSKDRSETSCDKLFDRLTDKQKHGVLAVATDFWQAYRNSIVNQVPDAEIVHDHFHISQYLGEAVDLVRRQENKTLRKTGDDSLTGTRQLWLYNSENLEDEAYEKMETARRRAIKTSRAWSLKELFRSFWTYRTVTWAKKFFKRWYAWAIRSRLKPIKKVAVMLNKHLEGLLAYFRHRISNAKSEAFNSRIQSIKSAARGFRSFKNYRIRILFYCGKLKLEPKMTH